MKEYPEVVLETLLNFNPYCKKIDRYYDTKVKLIDCIKEIYGEKKEFLTINDIARKYTSKEISDLIEKKIGRYYSDLFNSCIVSGRVLKLFVTYGSSEMLMLACNSKSFKDLFFENKEIFKTKREINAFCRSYKLAFDTYLAIALSKIHPNHMLEHKWIGTGAKEKFELALKEMDLYEEWLRYFNIKI